LIECFDFSLILLDCLQFFGVASYQLLPPGPQLSFGRSSSAREIVSHIVWPTALLHLHPLLRVFFD